MAKLSPQERILSGRILTQSSLRDSRNQNVRGFALPALRAGLSTTVPSGLIRGWKLQPKPGARFVCSPRIEMRLVRIRSPGGAIVFSPERSKPAAGRRRRSAGKVNLPPILFLLLKVP